MKVHGIFLTALMAIASFASAEELYKTNVIASYYGEELNGNKTASGEIFNMNDYTAAHNTLPFNTLVKVTSLVTSKSVVVRINDRGPSAPGREIDVSKAAASDLGMLKAGTARVSMEIIQWEQTMVQRPMSVELWKHLTRRNPKSTIRRKSITTFSWERTPIFQTQKFLRTNSTARDSKILHTNPRTESPEL